MKVVRDFYNRFPYPPIPAMALPRRGQGKPLAFEVGAQLAGLAKQSHDDCRILVAGAGTLEGLVVAEVHPRARQIVAVDISEHSLQRLRRRIRLARIRNTVYGLGLFRRLPPIELVCSDLMDYKDGPFDYVLATLVVHHHADPLALFQHLAGLVKPGGLLRLVTYPKQSRFWPRAVGSWLRAGGIDRTSPDLKRRANTRIAALPSDHPVRLSYTDNPESQTATGIADAYLHPCERPQSPLRFQAAARDAGLQLIGESQNPDCQSSFLDSFLPQLASLDPWEKLQLLDNLLELSSNPILWFSHGSQPQTSTAPATPRPTDGLPPDAGLVLDRLTAVTELISTIQDSPDTALWLPSRLMAELADGVHNCHPLFEAAGLGIDQVLAALFEQIGPRVSIQSNSQELPGLTLPERFNASMLNLPAPISSDGWIALQDALGSEFRLHGTTEIPGNDLTEQAEHLHIANGATQAWIGPLFLR